MADDSRPVPKYRAPDFMRKQFELYYGARVAARLARRYGDTDDAVEPVSRISAVQAINRVRSSDDELR